MREAPYNAKLNLHITEVVFDEPPPASARRAYHSITYAARTPAALARARAVLAELLEA
jgi:hypothetical protein